MKEKITVLIADDNQDFTNTLTGYLKKDPEMEIVGVAKDGNEAIEMIENVLPDVAILDVIMPHLDGLGVLERINNSTIKKRPITIMLSAVGQDKVTQRAIALGAQYYVVKPCDIELLIKRIKTEQLHLLILQLILKDYSVIFLGQPQAKPLTAFR